MDENGTRRIGPLETGEYTVKEEYADFDYFERTTTVSVNGGNDTTYSDKNGVNVSVEEGDASVHITNKYIETGAMIINKSFDDRDCEHKLGRQKENVTFTVKRASDGYVIKSITYAEIEKWMQLHQTYSQTFLPS